MYCDIDVLELDLMALVDEAQRLSELEGNCGRKIRRFFEQQFSDSSMHLGIEVLGDELADRRLYTDIVSRYVGFANEAAQCANAHGVARVRFSADENLEGRITLVISMPTVLPEGLKDRQMLLAEFAYSARRIVLLLTLVDREYLARERERGLEFV